MDIRAPVSRVELSLKNDLSALPRFPERQKTVKESFYLREGRRMLATQTHTHKHTNTQTHTHTHTTHTPSFSSRQLERSNEKNLRFLYVNNKDIQSCIWTHRRRLAESVKMKAKRIQTSFKNSLVCFAYLFLFLQQNQGALPGRAPLPHASMHTLRITIHTHAPHTQHIHNTRTQHTHTHMHTHKHARTHTHARAHTHTHMHMHTRIHTL